VGIVGRLKLLLKIRSAWKALEEGQVSWKTAWKALRTFGVGVLGVALPAAGLAVASLFTDTEALRVLLSDLPPVVQGLLLLGFASVGEYIRGAVKHRK